MTNPENSTRPIIPIERFARAVVELREDPTQKLKEMLTVSESQQAMMVGAIACYSGYCTDEMVKMMLPIHPGEAPKE